MFTNQTGNTAGGDVIAGNKVNSTLNVSISSASIEELSALYVKLKKDGTGDPSGGKFCEQLEHYLGANTEVDVRGLEAKLSESGRHDQLANAKQLKERATMTLMRYQTSRTAQRIYTILLTELHTKFELIVVPAIQDGAPRTDVDHRISLILDATKGMLGENPLEITVRDLLGLLYFLGGNCHIRWDKC